MVFDGIPFYRAFLFRVSHEGDERCAIRPKLFDWNAKLRTLESERGFRTRVSCVAMEARLWKCHPYRSSIGDSGG